MSLIIASIFPLVGSSYRGLPRGYGEQGNWPFLFMGTREQGWRQKFSDRGAGASDRGAKKTEKWCFRGYFAKFAPTRTKISSDGG